MNIKHIFYDIFSSKKTNKLEKKELVKKAIKDKKKNKK